MLEYNFYRLLETNKIKYQVGLSYPNSNYKYDFFLIDYNIYVEIAVMMCLEYYKDKMYLKKAKFNSEILETYEDMLNFIQKMKIK